jgi:pimeloyl-ACP methyl ester carboxylesterase
MSSAETAHGAHYTEPSFVEAGGVRVAYRRGGSGTPTVFLHGAGSTRMWLPFYARMAGSVDFLAPEHPGFGDTEIPEWVEGMDDLVLHYRAVLDAFDLDRVHLVGFSLGGWIAAEFAVFYPERLTSLTLITPAGLRVPGHPIADLFRMAPERIGGLLFNDRVEDHLEFLPDPHDVDAAIQGYTEMTTYARLAWNPRYDRKLDRRLAAVTAPALVVAADDDRIIPRAHPEQWARLLPNARLETVTGTAGPTGHALIMQEPNRAADLITGFIKECDS